MVFVERNEIKNIHHCYVCVNTIRNSQWSPAISSYQN